MKYNRNIQYALAEARAGYLCFIFNTWCSALCSTEKQQMNMRDRMHYFKFAPRSSCSCNLTQLVSISNYELLDVFWCIDHTGSGIRTTTIISFEPIRLTKPLVRIRAVLILLNLNLDLRTLISASCI
uniref:Uncharacterized protein n=1 Tax=Aplanochytrium stocchinoi TaxID=215587 RepID=A0A7S3PEU9_9STRA